MRTYAEAEARLDGRARRKVGNNTYLERRDDETIALRLHDTDVVTYRPGSVTLDSGGWRTVTTADRMRYAASVFQEKGIWYVSKPGCRWGTNGSWLYADGITLDEHGELISGAGEPEQRDAETAMSKRINAFAKLCGDQCETTPEPSGGDCWFCYFGWETGDHTHLLDHMEEGYVVPSLILRALDAKGYRFPGAVFRMKDPVTSSVRSYLKAHLLPTVTQSGFVKEKVTS